MIKTILVPVSGTPGDPGAFAASLRLAREFGAQLEFLHARLDTLEVVGAIGDASGLAAARIIDDLEADAAERETRARKAVEEFCGRERIPFESASARSGVSAHWRCETGSEPRWIGEYGRTSDLIVAARVADDQGASRETIEAALLDSGRPVVLPAETPLSLDTIAVAWKSTPEAARAVTAAGPFLTRAKLVYVLTAAEQDREDRRSAERLVRNLRRYGHSVEQRHVVPGAVGTGAALIAEAVASGVGLLVMGGYSHSRVRELVFGGVTSEVLRAAPVAVLMAH